jgi:exodeoxyribonuclease V alpha subunit
MSVQEFLEETGQEEERSDRAIKLFEKETLEELKIYLSSSIFRQVGPEIAQRIISAFGVRTVEVIEESPDKLDDVRGIGKLRVSSITKGWAIQRRIREACTQLVTPRSVH